MTKFSIVQSIWFGIRELFENILLFLGVIMTYVGWLVLTIFAVVIFLAATSNIIDDLREAFSHSSKEAASLVTNNHGTVNVVVKDSKGEVQVSKAAKPAIVEKLDQARKVLAIGKKHISNAAWWHILGVLALLFMGLVGARFLKLGLIKIGFAINDGKPYSYSMLFSQWHLVWRGVLGAILYTLMVLGGLILFILPGIYLAIRFGFYKQALVDKESGILDAFRESYERTEGSVMNLFGLGISQGILQSIVKSFMIFLHVAQVLTDVYVYRKLSTTPQVGNN